MLFRLDSVPTGKIVHKEIELEKAELDTNSGPVALKKFHAALSFQTDPLGYVVKYKIRADARAGCVRCGTPMEFQIETSDWISLRVRQPEDSHIVLDNSEMNVRFITDTELDMSTFTKEIIELELPPYPKHNEGEADCKLQAAEETESASSPFGVLGKLLDQ